MFTYNVKTLNFLSQLAKILANQLMLNKIEPVSIFGFGKDKKVKTV